jgi:hypothetical protein
MDSVVGGLKRKERERKRNGEKNSTLDIFDI